MLMPPALLPPGLKSEALERNANLDLVAGLGDPALGVEYEVRAQVGALALDHRVVEPVAGGGPRLHQCSVRLHSERIYCKDIGLPRVVEGAEQDLDVVVGRNPVAIGESGVHRAVRLERPDSEMDGGGRIPDQHFGGIRSRNAVRR